MTDIFVSYSRQDRDRVAELVAILQQEGWSVWWDREIKPGPSYHKEITNAVDSAGCVIVVWSESSVESEWVITEANEGLERGVLVPVMIDDVRLPLVFRGRQPANLVGWPRADQEELDSLSDAIRMMLGGAAAPRRITNRPTRRSPVMAYTIAVAVVIASGFALWTWMGRDGSGGSASQPEQIVSAKPIDTNSVSILSFTAVADAVDDRALAAGITADLIHDLSASGVFSVTALRSVRSLGSDSLTPQEIASRLGSRYLIEGIVQRSGSGYRVVVEIVDGVEGRTAWQQRYDYGADEVVAVQDAAVRDIGAALNFELMDIEMARIRSVGEGVKTPWDAYLMYTYFWWDPSEASLLNTIAALRAALEQEKNHGPVMSGLTNLLNFQIMMVGGPDRDALVQEACELTNRTVSLFGKQQWTLQETVIAMSQACGDASRAAEVAERAVELNENSSFTYLLWGYALQFAGRPEEALQRIDQGEAVYDGYSNSKIFALNFKALSYVQLGRWDDVVVNATRALEMSPSNVYAMIPLINSLAVTGRVEEAREHWQIVTRRFPSVNRRAKLTHLSG